MYKAFSRLLGSAGPVIIEMATPQDAPVLAEIHCDCFERGWSDGDFHSQLANKAYFCLKARIKGTDTSAISAFMLVRQVADEAEFITIATRKSARRQGFARHLMEAAIRKLEAERIRKVFLDVDENNLAACALYKSLAFKQIGEREGYYSVSEDSGKKRSRALVMQRELG